MIIRRDIEQRTDAWVEVKRNKVSGTGMKPILTARSQGPIENYIYDLIAQKDYDGVMTYDPGFLSKAVQWGQDMEPFAINRFEAEYGLHVESVGWLESTDARFRGKLGCSPDGLITVYEQVEVKCLATKNHIDCIVNNRYPKDHHSQVINYFVVNGKLRRLYFIMYDPRVKTEKNQLFVIEILRKDVRKEIKEAKKKLVEFFKLKREIEVKYYKK